MRLRAIGSTGLTLLALTGLLTVPSAFAVEGEAEVLPQVAASSLMLDVTESDQRAVMVGERGHILVSESRNDWRQVAGVPTRVTLTGVAAVGAKVWAVGHDGVILHSADGGLTWVMQRSDPWKPLADDAEFDPRQGVPLLDIVMIDGDNGLAVGAYSLMLRTSNGGQTWEPVSVSGQAAPAEAAAVAEETDMEDEEVDWNFSDEDLQLDEETDPHLNGIARTGDGSLIVVGERGAAFRSRDAGVTWERVKIPYEGSMFGVLGHDNQRVVAFGMRGNVFESADLGSTWKQLDSGTDQTLMGGAALPSGGAVLVGGSGAVALRAEPGAAFTSHTFSTSEQETPVLAAVLPLGAATFVVGGEKGLGRFQSQQQAGE
ncbi:MAG: WD40/YVTN/BNR-like repeat-containing protein [Pseudomarimonas sp.]